MSAQSQLSLQHFPGEYWVCRLPAGCFQPVWLTNCEDFISLTKTLVGEWSLVCSAATAKTLPKATHQEGPFSLLGVVGTLDFSLTGILHRLTAPLAHADISVFALSTYDTDYLLVPSAKFTEACQHLTTAGYGVINARKV